MEVRRTSADTAGAPMGKTLAVPPPSPPHEPLVNWRQPAGGGTV